MISPADAVRAALTGKTLDVAAFDEIVHNPAEAEAQRSTLAPLIAKLARVDPEAAAEIPAEVVAALFRGVPFATALELTGITKEALDDSLLRPWVLALLADCASNDEEIAKNADFAASALSRLADPSIDAGSVAQLERLLLRAPQLCADVPFSKLYTGSSELQARLMGLNVVLLGSNSARKFVKNEFLIPSRLESVEGDVLLLALQIDYIGDLAKLQVSAETLRAPVEELCKLYVGGEAPMLASTLERAISRVAHAQPALFAELDRKFKLVNDERLALVAQLPATYVVKEHSTLVENLELRNRALMAIANVAQIEEGIKLLPLTASALSKLPAPSQLLVAACATVSEYGAKYFADRFMDCLKVAAGVPESAETTDLLATLRANTARWRIRIPRDAIVAVA